MATTAAVMKACFPRANAVFVTALSARAPQIMARYGITTAEAQCQVLAQAGHETQGFTRFEENMNYTAPRIRTIFAKRVPSDGLAKQLAHNPRGLANHVYGDRNGNRAGTDDGWDFRGSGIFHHTFRSEMDRVSKATGLNVIQFPKLLRDPGHAEAMLHAACSYVVARGMLSAANQNDTLAFTKKLNGGTIGLTDRKTLVTRVWTGMGGKPLTITGVETVTVATGPKTAVEDAQDSEARARRATQAAPASGTLASGGSASADGGTDVVGAVIIGVTVLIAVGVVAYFMTRAAKKRREAVEVERAKELTERHEHQSAIAA